MLGFLVRHNGHKTRRLKPPAARAAIGAYGCRTRITIAGADETKRPNDRTSLALDPAATRIVACRIRPRARLCRQQADVAIGRRAIRERTAHNPALDCAPCLHVQPTWCAG